MEAYLKGKESVTAVVAAMSIREKAKLLCGRTLFSTLAFEKYGIPSITFVDCASGINLMQRYMDAVASVSGECGEELYDADEKLDGVSAMLKVMGSMDAALELVTHGIDYNGLSPVAKAAAEYLRSMIPEGKFPTCFPPGIMLGASWNPQAVREIGSAVGAEAAAYGIDVLLGSPNVNIHRDPRNGRLFEGFSEDPYLVSALAPELVKGVQSQHIGANVKHFAANNQETLRIGINAHVSERALREIYFPGFEACVRKGNVLSLMSAYNSINGQPCSHNRWLMSDVLRGEWRFEGFTVSDWGADYDRPASLEAGIDLDMPGPRAIKDILEAISTGRLSITVLNQACERFLRIVVELMEMRQHREKDFSIARSTQAAYRLAAEGITLLKNNETLPLRPGAKICFFGEKSKEFLASGLGSALVITDRYTSFFDETAAITGQENVFFNVVKEDCDLVVITVGKPSSEGYDQDDLYLPLKEREMMHNALRQAKAKGKKTLLVLNAGCPLEVESFIRDIDAMLWVYFPGQEGGKAAADILFGRINPSGKLPLTYPRRYADCPTYGNFPGEGEDVWYGEGVFVGYRWFDKRKIKPLFPFGHGLSYTTFQIENLRLSAKTWTLGKKERLRIEATVKNTGGMAGSEVVQLYLSDEDSTLPKPVKELKGFKKVYLQPGQAAVIHFDLEEKTLKSFDPQWRVWTAEPGWYTVEVGSSSQEIFCTERFYVKGRTVYDYGPETLFIKIQSDERAMSILYNHVSPYVKMEVVAGSLTFTPYLPLRLVWQNLFHPPIRAAGADADAIWEALLKELGQLDIGQAPKEKTPLNT